MGLNNMYIIIKIHGKLNQNEARVSMFIINWKKKGFSTNKYKIISFTITYNTVRNHTVYFFYNKLEFK